MCVEGGGGVFQFENIILVPLMGGPQCRLSILRNGNVPCRYFLNVPVYFKKSPMSPVDFKKCQCPLSLILKIPCRFKDSKGQGPQSYL